jgi:TonB family protein
MSELIYRHIIPKRAYYFLIGSMIVHTLLVFLLVTRRSSVSASSPFMSEITYEEEQMLRGPELLGSDKKGGVPKPPGDVSDIVGNNQAKNPDGTAFGLGGEQPNQPVTDLNAKVDLSQAEINIDQYDDEDEDAQVLVRIADTGAAGVKSTDEILAEKPINLAKNLPPGSGSSGGTMRPGSASGGSDIDVVPFYKVEVKPEPIYIPPLEYPDLARKAGIEGRVMVKMLVDIDGAIMEALILQSSGNQNLDEAALAFARRCRFKPAQQHHKPVRVWVNFPVDYLLQNTP